MKKPLTKTKVYPIMMDICKKSYPLKDIKQITDTWTLNQLIYCLEILHYDNDILVEVNTENGTYFPISGVSPTFIPARDRSKKIRIVDFESYLRDEDNEDEGYIYLIIIKEV